MFRHLKTIPVIFLTFFIISCTSLPPDEGWSDDKVVLTLSSGITVTLGISADERGEELRFQGRLPGAVVKNTEFWRVLPGKKTGLTKISAGYAWNDITILPLPEGFSINRGDEVLASVFFQNDFGKMRVITKNFQDEKLYGFGGASDTLTLNGREFPLYQKAHYGNQNYINIPFYLSSGGDGFYFNGSTGDNFSFGKDKDTTTTISSRQGFQDGYYFWAAKPDQLVKHYYYGQTRGTPPPSWAFGYIQSKYGYRSQDEVQELIDGFEARGIMPSAIVLDLFWFGRMGDLDWNRNEDAFPDPEAMDKMLESKGVKLLAISEPYYTEDSKNYTEWAKKGYFIVDKVGGDPYIWESWWCMGDGAGSMVNPWAPGAAQALGQKYVDMVKSGIDGFWTDLGEPEDSPDEALFPAGSKTYKKDDVHNYYNREWSRIIHEAVTKAFPDKRFFMLSRSGFTGSAKYDLSVWSGDVDSSFKGLDKQTGIGLNLGLSGFPYFGSDVGGFSSKGKPSEPELFARWHQAGVWHPIYRAHGAAPREPWSSGKDAENRVIQQIKFRSEMLPYFYSLAWEAQKGTPMMAPVFYYYPEWTPAWTAGDCFFSGPAFLVYPVSQPMTQADSMTVNLPPGNWKTFPDGPILPGGSHQLKLSMEGIPVFLKEGAIVPRQKSGNLELLLYPGNTPSSFTYYDDSHGPLETVKITLEKGRVTCEGFTSPRPLSLAIIQTDGKTLEVKTQTDGKTVLVKTW